MSLSTHDRAVELRARHDELLAAEPRLRIRNAAERLGVSELELVAAGAGGLEATPLRSPPQEIFRQLGSLGRVMALTRNDHCVHERHGRYEDIRAGNTMGIVLGPDIDLRMFFTHWAHTWAVQADGRRSLQFFDSAGTALHKVYLTPESDETAFDSLMEKFAQPAADWPSLQPLPPAEKLADTAPSALRDDWLAMQDTHEFFSLLKRHGVERLAALRDVGPDLAQQVAPETAERMLGEVAQRQIPFMCFVGNHGIIQIHSGSVARLQRTGPWFNVLEPHFNLHLNTTAVDSAWVVNKPTVDGWVTSLECYTATGELIVQFFGVRKPGIPEIREWRELLQGFCPTPLAA